MLVTFRSSATETITLFQDVALQLIKAMGHSGTIPGALAAEDVPQALRSLEAAIDQYKALARQAARDRPDDEQDEDEDEEDPDRTRPVDLATRAVPLISLLRRAAEARAEVLWEQQ